MGYKRGAWPERFNVYFKPRGKKPAEASSTSVRAAAKTASHATLSPQQGDIDRAMSRHLLRRTGLGAAPDRKSAIENREVTAVVSELMQDAISRPMPEPPHWENAFLPPDGSSDEIFQAYFDNNSEWGVEYMQDWVLKLYDGGLREKMTLFWSGHFVTEIDVYFFAPMAFRYLTLLRRHALGNFKQLVYEIGLDPAMLVYLDGNENYWWEPNENYARELLELFTMGHFDKAGNENYTQDDIVELSRALTGWQVDYYSYSAYFDEGLHDTLKKNIFGVEDFFDYEKVIDHIFETRAPQIAHFICTKIYANFVHDTPDDQVVDAMVEIFIANDFEIAPVVEALLKSEHFFAPEFRGAKIKSPTDMMIGMMLESGAEKFGDDTHQIMFWLMRELGQQLLQPPNVAGWSGYRDWISTATMPNRWDLSAYMSYELLTGTILSLIPLVEKLVDVNDPLLAFHLPVALAEHFMAVSPDQLGFEAPVNGFGGDLITYPIPAEILDAPQHVQDLAKIFLQGVPWYEWHLGQGGIVFFLLDYLKFLTELPEYQLI